MEDVYSKMRFSFGDVVDHVRQTHSSALDTVTVKGFHWHIMSGAELENGFITVSNQDGDASVVSHGHQPAVDAKIIRPSWLCSNFSSGAVVFELGTRPSPGRVVGRRNILNF